MVLACQNICKSFGTDEIIRNASFHVNEDEKVAIVGINGAGKTTLLKIIMNEMSKDSGEVIIAKGKTIGYLPQNPDISGNRTIYEEVLLAKESMIEMEQKLRKMEEDMNSCPKESFEDLMDSYSRLNHPPNIFLYVISPECLICSQA